MNSHHKPAMPQEVELKLYLLSADPASLAHQLARTPPLRRRKVTQQQLHNIYFDTPDQQLRQQRAVLRLRRVGEAARPQWLQTFKTGAANSSALSRRGEWESPVATPALSRLALNASPWAELDPDDRLFAALVPCFVTVFERCTWLVHWRDGSLVEVALDRGHIEASGRRAPICELELELKSGQPDALFALAHELARGVAVMPATMSKAQRGFLLAQDGLNLAHHARLPALPKGLPLPLLAQHLLRHLFAQFTNNLDSLRVSDEPEVVHQARVGWRRFKSGMRLFRKVLAMSAPPALDDLQPLLADLGELRNMDVTCGQILPALASAYAMGDARRTQVWQAMMETLTQAAAAQRTAVRQTLQWPGAGSNLLALTHWLESLTAATPVLQAPKTTLRHWATRRMVRLSRQLALAQQQACTPQQWHRVRILAKRLRYNSEAVHDLLPRRLAKRGEQQAATIQDKLGAARDLAQASALLARLEVDPSLVEFLRGVAVGQRSNGCADRW